MFTRDKSLTRKRDFRKNYRVKCFAISDLDFDVYINRLIGQLFHDGGHRHVIGTIKSRVPNIPYFVYKSHDCLTLTARVSPREKDEMIAGQKNNLISLGFYNSFHFRKRFFINLHNVSATSRPVISGQMSPPRNQCHTDCDIVKIKSVPKISFCYSQGRFHVFSISYGSGCQRTRTDWYRKLIVQKKLDQFRGGLPISFIYF